MSLGDIKTQQTHLAVVIPFQMQRLNAAAPTARSPDSRVVTVWSLISHPYAMRQLRVSSRPYAAA